MDCNSCGAMMVDTTQISDAYERGLCPKCGYQQTGGFIMGRYVDPPQPGLKSIPEGKLVGPDRYAYKGGDK